MNNTATHLTMQELNEYVRRGHVARSEAIAAMFRRIWAKLTGRPQAAASAKYA